MTISLTINGTAAEVITELQTFLARAGGPANIAQPEAVAELKTFGDQGKFAERDGEAKPKGRRKAPASEVVIEGELKAETTSSSTEATTSDAPMLTVEDARERMKKFAADGHMDQVSAALESFSVKKVSDIDSDAKGKPSIKFAEFVAKIEALVASKV